MADKTNRLDVLNKERFMDVISGEAPIDLGFVTGIYRNQPSEILVMVLSDSDDDDDLEVSTIPLAVFLSEEDLTYIEIPNGSDIETITFSEEPENEGGEETEDVIDLSNFKPKGPAH